jgi:CRISPR-associated protein Csm2
MRNDRGPRPGQNFAGAQRPSRPAGGGPPEERIKAILRSTEGVAYVSAANPGPDFLDRDARQQAEDFHELHTSQLRRFYGMATTFRRRLEIDDTLGDDDVQAQMAYLKAAAAYAAMRHQPDELPRFFTKHANSVKTRAQFERFCRHFEAVVAYHKVFGRERGG